MTDGTYTGLDDAAIIQLLIAASAPGVEPDNNDDNDAADNDDGELNDNGSGTEGPGGGEPDDSGPDGASASGAAPARPDRTAVGAGLELQVRWTSRLGHTYQHQPPAIVEPLPDPIPRDRPPYPLVIPLDDGWEDTEIWEDLPPEPEPDPEPDPPPEPDPSADIPPF